MKKYILAVMLVFATCYTPIARAGDALNYEQKPHLEIKCPCSASFITYEWLGEALLIRVDKFIEKHPCGHIDPVGIMPLLKRHKGTGIEKLIGKMVYRTKPCGFDKSYTKEPRRLLAVTNEYLILSSDILANGQFEIERDEWDDGNWKEFVKPKKRLTINEQIGTETFHTMHCGGSSYYCFRCGNALSINPTDYYCISCKTGWNIKEE